MDITKSILRNAILLLDKSEGKTSFAAINEVKRLLGEKKIGHSGTLDKFATGLLVICLGRTTKLTRYFLEHDKKYIGHIQLGTITDTNDSEGEVLEERSFKGIAEAAIYSCIAGYKGKQLQKPPKYSALKIQGQRASDLVRQGKEIELNEREIVIHDISVEKIDLINGNVDIAVHCSKGTYIRSLARDIGNDLETGAYLKKLRRIASGNFSVNNAVTISELKDYIDGKPTAKRFFYSPIEALADFSSIIVNDVAAKKVMNGAFFEKDDIVAISENMKKTYIILDKEKNLIAIADIDIKDWHISYKNVFL